MINYLKLVEDTEEGNEDPFKAMAILKELESDIKKSIKQIQPIVVEEAAKYDKTFEHKGLKIEQRVGRRVWNFKGVEEWVNYDNFKKQCEDRLKAAYSAHEKGMNMADEEGEIIPLPECTFAADVVVIKNLGESLIH